MAAFLTVGTPAHAVLPATTSETTQGTPTTQVTQDPLPLKGTELVEDPTALGEGLYFGPELDWSEDDAQAYAGASGVQPSFLSRPVPYPLDAGAEAALLDLAQQEAPLGAIAVITLEPTRPLDELTEDDAARLTETLGRLSSDFGTAFFLRFAPEMNGTWFGWGQQPVTYIDAFRTVADAVHADVPSAAMVWSPSYAAGYPFTEAYGAVEGFEAGTVTSLDTNGNGLIDVRDDPYAPYYPGDDAVDWVGLSMYHFGSYEQGAVTVTEGTREYSGAIETSVLPEEDKFADQLAGVYGAVPGAPQIDFAKEYASGRDQRMMVQTAALYDPADPESAPELGIKQAWLEQLLDPALLEQYPEIGALLWLELSRPEPEAEGRTVDWRLAADEDTTAALQDTLRGTQSVRLGPIVEVIQPEEAGGSTSEDTSEATSQVWESGSSTNTAMNWLVGSVVGLFLLVLAAGFARRFIPGWRYPDERDPRDTRLDLLRGWIITAVVVTHIEVAGPWSFLALNIIGAISGAELFVLLSGVVMGMVYPVAVRKLGSGAALKGTMRRALRLYLTALGVVIVVYLLSLVPFIDASVITTFTDRGTGDDGGGAAGRVYDLYPNAARLFDYPPPGYAIRDLLLLNMGPWTFNIMGLFVVLTLLVPPLVELLRRKLWWLLLIVSWSLYLLDSIHHVRVFNSQFQDVFPFLTWQVIFVHGVVVGFHRRRIIDTLSLNAGRILFGVLLGVYALGLAVLWADTTYALQLPFVPAGFYESLYNAGYVRVFMQPGRLIDLAFFVIAAHIVLTCFWKPLNAAFGWLYIPLGRSSLYVFIVHVFFVLAVGNLPGLDRTGFWQGFLIHSVVTLVIWVMVKRKFLFTVIPN